MTLCPAARAGADRSSTGSSGDSERIRQKQGWQNIASPAFCAYLIRRREGAKSANPAFAFLDARKKGPLSSFSIAAPAGMIVPAGAAILIQASLAIGVSLGQALLSPLDRRASPSGEQWPQARATP